MDGSILNFPHFLQRVSSPVGGLQIITSEGELFNHVDNNDYMWTGDGDRVVRIPVEFSQPFDSAPHITAGVSGIDAAHTNNQRFHLTVEMITNTSFELVFLIWGDTKIARASASWSAMGSTRKEMPPIDDIETLFTGAA